MIENMIKDSINRMQLRDSSLKKYRDLLVESACLIYRTHPIYGENLIRNSKDKILGFVDESDFDIDELEEAMDDNNFYLPRIGILLARDFELFPDDVKKILITHECAHMASYHEEHWDIAVGLETLVNDEILGIVIAEGVTDYISRTSLEYSVDSYFASNEDEIYKAYYRDTMLFADLFKHGINDLLDANADGGYNKLRNKVSYVKDFLSLVKGMDATYNWQYLDANYKPDNQITIVIRTINEFYYFMKLLIENKTITSQEELEKRINSFRENMLLAILDVSLNVKRILLDKLKYREEALYVLMQDNRIVLTKFRF